MVPSAAFALARLAARRARAALLRVLSSALSRSLAFLVRLLDHPFLSASSFSFRLRACRAFCSFDRRFSRLFCASAAVRRCTASVIACDKVRGNGHEVLLELCGGGCVGVGGVPGAGGGSRISVVLVANHDLSPALPKDVFDELEGDPAQSVSVGHHNLADVSADRAVQNGEQAPAVKVDAGRDILNDLVIGIAAGEVLALADEVGALLGAGDAAVDSPGAGGRRRGLLRLRAFSGRGGRGGSSRRLAGCRGAFRRWIRSAGSGRGRRWPMIATWCRRRGTGRRSPSRARRARRSVRRLRRRRWLAPFHPRRL